MSDSLGMPERDAAGQAMRPPSGDPPDETILSGLRSGDGRAYEILVRTYSGRLLSVARRFLRNDADAADAVQDAFVSAFKAIGSFTGEARLSTWLHRIVVNACLMKIRSRGRSKEESIEHLLPVFDETGHRVDPGPDWDDPDQAFERSELCALVRRCIDELPDSYRTILLLRDIEEVDTEETAALLGITENAVRIRLHRARQALRALLDPHLRSESA